MNRRVLALGAISLTALVTTSAARIAASQSPFKPPSNLRVLPKDTTLAALIPLMKTFTVALGVRCEHCHTFTGTDASNLQNFDFPNDDKPAKLTARTMMSMLQAINTDFLKGVGEDRPADQPKVSCYTCHRGARKPLLEAGKSGGTLM